jgi:hypothetical protein
LKTAMRVGYAPMIDAKPKGEGVEETEIAEPPSNVHGGAEGKPGAGAIYAAEEAASRAKESR